MGKIFFCIYPKLYLSLLKIVITQVHCDQIGRLIALWATFLSLWQQFFCPKCPHFSGMFVKVSKSLIFLGKYFWVTSSPSSQDWLNCLMAFHWGNWENNLYEIVHEKVTSLSHSRSRLPNPIACGRLGNLKNEHIKVKQTELELMTSPILKSH